MECTSLSLLQQDAWNYAVVIGTMIIIGLPYIMIMDRIYTRLNLKKPLIEMDQRIKRAAFTLAGFIMFMICWSLLLSVCKPLACPIG